MNIKQATFKKEGVTLECGNASDDYFYCLEEHGSFNDRST